MPYKCGDIVEVAFPFVERPVQKRRPAFVLSDRISGDGHDVLVLSMVTSAERRHWEYDVEILDWQQAGLRGPSVVRWKIFSLDAALILNPRGSVSTKDMQRISESFRSVFGSLL